MDTLTLGGLVDPGQMVDVRDRFVIHHGSEGDAFNSLNVFTFFGSPVEYLV